MNSIDDSRAILPANFTAILARQKWQILFVFVFVVAGVAAGTLLIPKQYKTRMKFLVKNERADMVVSPDLDGGSGYRSEISEAQINSEIELLTSNDLLQQVVTSSGLYRAEHPGEPVPDENMDEAILRFQRHLKITPARKANIIQVEYIDTSPKRAVSVLQHMADSYLETHLRVHGTPGTYEFFSGELARHQSALGDAEATLAEFRQRENIVSIDRQKDLMLQKISEAQSALKQTEAAASEYTHRIEDIRIQLNTAPPRLITQSRVVPNQYSVERLNTMLAELQNRRTQLLAKFLPDDRNVEELDREIADTKAALSDAAKMTGVEQATDINPLHQSLQLELAKAQAELAGIAARKQTLARQEGSYRGELARLDNATARYDDLLRNSKQAEENYLLYAKKTEEARIAESLDRQKIANVAIVEQPIEPHLPSKPNVALNLALGVALGGFLSLSFAFVWVHFYPVAHGDSENRTGPLVLDSPSVPLSATHIGNTGRA